MPYGDSGPGNKRHRGASRQKRSPANKTRNRFATTIALVLKHNASSLVQSLVRQLRSPVSSLLTWSVIGIALTLPVGLYLVVDHIERANRDARDPIRITLFTKSGVTMMQAQQHADRIRQSRLVRKVQVLSPEQARQDFRRMDNADNLLAGMGKVNPFPVVMIVSLKQEVNSPASVRAFAAKLQKFGKTRTILLDKTLINRLYTLEEIGNRSILILGLILSIGTILIVGNTIRLDIENRRDEIIIKKMVGATDSWIRTPILYSGFWYGLFGGLVAWLITLVSVLYLKKPVTGFFAITDQNFSVTMMNVKSVGILLGLAALLGWTGSWLASRRHLKQIEPS